MLPVIISLIQSVGIVIDTPNRGQLHVASPSGSITVAAFRSAGAVGISIDDNNPLIGFNNYKEAGVRKFMGASMAYGSLLYFQSSLARLRYDIGTNSATERQILHRTPIPVIAGSVRLPFKVTAY